MLIPLVATLTVGSCQQLVHSWFSELGQLQLSGSQHSVVNVNVQLGFSSGG